MPNDPVTEALNSAKSTLEKANNFTQTVEGNPTSAFAPKKPEPPKTPKAPRRPSYSLASKARALVSGFGNEAEGLKSRQQNVQQYVDANKK